MVPSLNFLNRGRRIYVMTTVLLLCIKGKKKKEQWAIEASISIGVQHFVVLLLESRIIYAADFG
jgi:hypothetical protein